MRATSGFTGPETCQRHLGALLIRDAVALDVVWYMTRKYLSICDTLCRCKAALADAHITQAKTPASSSCISKGIKRDWLAFQYAVLLVLQLNVPVGPSQNAWG